MNTPPDYLAKKNKHPRDEGISFEEVGHIYTINGERGTYVSTTTFIHHNFSDFDADKIIDGMIAKKKLEDPTNKYYGMTKEQIKTMWDKNRDSAAGSGTKMHYDIECFSNGQTVENTSIEYQYFLQFRRDFPDLKPYRTEWMVYYEEYKLCGSIDMVYETPDGSLEIYDWKRSKEIVYDTHFDKYAKTECIKHLPDTNYWHYSLQLNTYKKILEEKYQKADGSPIKISGMYLVVCHPDQETYDRVEVRHMPKEIGDLFEIRRQQTLKKKTK